MAHQQQLNFVGKAKELLPEFFRNRRVLEIGSLDINGSIRRFFEDCEYTGIDVASGPGVDVVCQGQDYDAPDETFDVVVSCEVMEHNPHWVETMRNMVRLCKPGGLVLMTCATLGRREHGTARTSSSDSPLTTEMGWTYYYNLAARDFEKSGALAGLSHVFVCDWNEYDLYMLGVKGDPDDRIREVMATVERDYRKILLGSWKCMRRSIKARLLNRRN